MWPYTVSLDKSNPMADFRLQVAGVFFRRRSWWLKFLVGQALTNIR